MAARYLVVALVCLLSVPHLSAAPNAPGPQAKPSQKPAPKPAPAKPAAPTKAAPAAKPEPPAPPPGVRVTTAYTHGAQVSENTAYLQGARQRVEFPGVVTLEQCDLKRTVMLNTTDKRYRVQPYPEPAPQAAAAATETDQMALMAQAMSGAQKPQARGGVVTFTTTLIDTLERQQMFGLEARRIKTVIVKQASPSACDKSPLRIEVDGWYVDLPNQTACTRPAAPAPPKSADPAVCSDTIETSVQGDVKLGFPLKLATATTTGEGKSAETTTTEQDVTALEIARLDRALFEVPAGFTEANSTAEILPAVAKGESLNEALFGSTADGTSAAAPKKPGVVRFGILEPVNKTTRDIAVAGLREDLVSKFKRSGYEALPLAGSSASAIEQDAARLNVDYVMLAEIVEAKTSKPGRLSGLTKIAGGGPPKDSHEVKIDYKLFAVKATQTPAAAGNAKASNGGFGIGSALRIAAFAGQMYMNLMMGGMGMGMMNPMMAMSGMGGLGAGGGGLFDPRASAMSSMMAGFGGAGIGGGVPDDSEAGMRDTISEAMGNSAKAAMDQLAKRR
jgi:hypothetical protein